MEYSKKLNFNPKDIAEFVSEIKYKLKTTVRNNWFRGTIELVNIINIKAGYILYSYGFKIKEEDRLLIELVNYYKGRVIAIGVF